MLVCVCVTALCVCVCVSPGNVVNGLNDGVAERVASDLQHAARDEQEEQEDAAHDYDHVHPHALPVDEQNTQKERA